MKKLFIILFICTGIAATIASCQSDEEITYTRYYTGGLALYQTHCQNCHGQNGEGLSALMPPLTDTAYIRKNKNELACYVKNGISGIISVSGKFYENKMPPADLAPIEIAKVLTYVGNSFGNKVGLIDLAQVEKDLKGCK
jgi:mono/diheme cytochrome c family protein